MTPQELKESIICLAMKGQLTSQLDSDGNSANHLALVASYKKAHKIADNKKMLPISDEDIPFEIPETWSWVRFGSIVNYKMGKTPPRAEAQWWSSDIPWVSIADMPENDYVSSTKEKVSESAIASIFGGRVSKAGTLLMSFKLTVGRVSILGIDAVHNEAIISIYPYCDEDKIVQSYLFQLLPIISQYGDSKNAIKGKTLNDTSICNLMIPFPPLAEQKRIVAKIEELLPLIDRYEQAWTKLEAFNKRFPSDMQKSLLQLAIQGKLVDQRPEEGTGEDLYRQIQAEKQALIRSGKLRKDKPLPEITEGEIPFDIPESWMWVHFSDLYSLSNGTASRGTDGGMKHPVLRLADISNNRINTDNIREIALTEKEYRSHTLQTDDLIFIRVNGSKDRVATAYHYKDTSSISYCDHLFCGHRTSNHIYANYVMLVFNCPSTRKQLLPEIKTTAGQNTISQTSMAKMILPLPPFAEQKRIVAKLEELLPLSDKLK